MNKVLEGCTLDYFKSGAYKATMEEFLEMKKEGKAIMIDLRTKDEADLISFSFAKNIPIDELPARLDELPKDKTIVTFCASSVRAVMAFFYLQSAGYDSKIYLGKINDLTAPFMPPFVAKNYDILKEE